MMTITLPHCCKPFAPAACMILAMTSMVYGQSIGRIYWTDDSSDRIRRANLDGSGMQDLVAGVPAPFGIAVDTAANRVYWTDFSSKKIQRASSVDGSGLADLVTTGLDQPRGIAVDPAGGKMFWADRGATKKIVRANLDGSGVQTIVSSGLGEPNHLAVDLSVGKLYWADFGADKIRRASLDGSNAEDVLTGLSDPTAIALDLVGAKAYWTDFIDDRIYRANLSGSGMETVVSGLGEAQAIGVDSAAGKVYWADIAGGGNIQRSNLNGSSVETVLGGTGTTWGLVVAAAPDCNANGIPDTVDIAGPTSEDCNTNNLPDECDISGPTSQDCNSNTVADECEPDCNDNGQPDVCDLPPLGGGADCNANSIPDECEVPPIGAGDDCNSNGTPDECEVPPIGMGADCDGNGVPDACQSDCDASSVPDVCEILAGTSVDCNSNGIPDQCPGGMEERLWIGADGASFTVASNWNPAVAPSSAKASLVRTAAGDNRCVLSDPGPFAVCALRISGTGSGRQILRIDTAAVLDSVSGTLIETGGDINLQGGELTGGPVQNAGDSLVGYGRVSADVTNSGRIESFFGQTLTLAGGRLENQPAGRLRAAFASRLHVRAADVSQAGVLAIRPESAVQFDAPLINDSGGLIELLGGSLAADALTNQAGGNLAGFGNLDSDVVNLGSMTIVADTQILGNLQNDGTIVIQSGILTVLGNLNGTGVIIGGLGR